MLSNNRREAIDLMLGTDPCQPIPSAVELLQHPWFPTNGSEDKDGVVPMPLAPGQKVAIGPPARPERVPTGLPPAVPKLSGITTVQGGALGDTSKASPWVDMPDGSQALSAWLMKRSSWRNALRMKSPW